MATASAWTTSTGAEEPGATPVTTKENHKQGLCPAGYNMEATLQLNSLGGSLGTLTTILPLHFLQLKQLIANATGIPANEQQLLIGTKQLFNNECLDFVSASASDITLIRCSSRELLLAEMQRQGAIVLARAKALRSQ